MPNRVKFLAFGCRHLPVHHEGFRQWVLEKIREHKPDYIINLGDWHDAEYASRWADTNEEDWDSEKEFQWLARDARETREAAPKAKIIWTKGNHCDNPAAPGRVSKKVRASVEARKQELLRPHISDWKIIPYGHDRFFRLGQVTFQHGCQTNVNAERDQSILYGVPYGLHVSAHCFDDQTEILTPGGWVTHDQLKVGTEVATYSRAADSIVYQAVEEVVRYEHSGEMVRVKTQSVDLLVTGEHGLWLSSRKRHKHEGKWVESKGEVFGSKPKKGKARNGIWFESTANESFGKGTVIRQGAPTASRGINASDDEIRFAAWIMAEGTLDVSNKRVSGIRIAQSDAPDGRLDRLESLLTRLGLPYTKTKVYEAGSTKHGTHRNWDAYRYRLHDSGRVYDRLLSDLMSHKKHPSRLLAQMSCEQIRVFLNEYVWGDGYQSCANSWQIAAKPKPITDFIQEICIKAGFRATVSLRPGGYYAISVCSRRDSTIKPSSWSKEEFSGTVWCVRVPNGTLVVRRGGRACITLNTHRPQPVTRIILPGKVPIFGMHYANVGTGADWTKMKYIQRSNHALWGRAILVGDCNPARSWFGSKQWDAELIIHSTASDR